MVFSRKNNADATDLTRKGAENIEHRQERGIIYFQAMPYTEEQLLLTAEQFPGTLLGRAPLFLFGDHVDEITRDCSRGTYCDGQALVCGQFDRSIAYGIPIDGVHGDFKQFQSMCDQQFAGFGREMESGRHIVCVAAPAELMEQYPDIFFDADGLQQTELSQAT